MATNTALRTEPQHPPLARDAQGNLVAIPNGTAAWRICRQTTGRPKEIVGPDGAMLRFPLETSAEELADLCGADVYRVYALDEVGKVLDYVATVDIAHVTGELRNASPEASVPAALRPASAMPTSDLRFALEAMAQMMRVNSEALRAVTEAQADWVKSIASMRGFFRNAPPQLSPPPAEPTEEDDDEDEYDELPPNKTIYDVLAPLAEHWAPAAKPFVSMLASGVGASAIGGAPADAQVIDVDLASRPNWEARDLIDLNYASAKAKAKKAAKAGAAVAASPSLQTRVMADPKLMAHFLAIKLRLSAQETAQLLDLGERMSQQQQEWLIQQISGVGPEDAATLLRTTLVEFAKESSQASNNDQPK